MEEKTFKNLKAIAAFLRGQGWKVSKSTVYEHGKTRKIKPRQDGLFYLADVEAYAGAYLKKKDSPLTQTSDAIQRRRNEAEARKMEAQAQHWEVKAKVLTGAYVERETFERELVKRLIVFRSDLNNFAPSSAEKITAIVSGDPKKVPELIEYMQDAFAEFLHRYSADREFKVPREITAKTDVLLDDDDEEDDNDADFEDNSPENEPN